MKIFDKLTFGKLKNKFENHPDRADLSLLENITAEHMRFRIHVQTDKPIYRPGETIHFRAWLFHLQTHLPLPSCVESLLPFNIEILSPGGEKVFSAHLTAPQQSLLCHQWEIPNTQAGGDYILKVFCEKLSSIGNGLREFNIRAFRPTRLNNKIDFEKKGYGAGQLCKATLESKRVEGGFPVNAKVTVVARIDGNEVFRDDVSYSINNRGLCSIGFPLPSEIEVGVGTLACTIEDGGIVENASKTLPLLLRAMKVDIYPEGGKLVAGLMSRFYCEAFTPTNDPADIEADIVDDNDAILGTIRTTHEGRGVSEFVPNAETSYWLKINKPYGIVKKIKLPPVEKMGVSLKSLKDTFTKKKGVKVCVNTTHTETLEVKLFQGEEVIDIKSLIFQKNHPQIVDLDPQEREGVLRVTVFRNLLPLTERLVFLRPQTTLDLQLLTSKLTYAPGDSCSLTFKTYPGAHVSISVVDKSVVKMVEKRLRAPRLPAMVFLENEVNTLFDSGMYLKSSKEGKTACDLLLGTQGWRQFIYVNPECKTWKNLCLLSNENEWMNLKSSPFPNTKMIMPFMPPVDDFPVDFEGDFFEPAMIIESKPDIGALPQENIVALPQENIIASPEIEEEILAPPPPPPAQEMKLEKREDLDFEPFEDLDFEEDELWISDSEEDLIEIDPSLEYIRVYAHSAPKKYDDKGEGIRTDFEESLYFNSSLPANHLGELTIEFTLSESITSFVVFADCYSDGLFGSASFTLESKVPFYCEPKLPLEVTVGDHIELPVALINECEGKLGCDIRLSFPRERGIVTYASSSQACSLPSKARNRVLFPLDVESYDGDVSPTEISVSATGKHKKITLSDTVIRSTQVVPPGFPVRADKNGTLSFTEPDNATELIVTLPNADNLVPNSLTLDVTFVASMQGNISTSLKGLITRPCGCFEQTSSSNYPLIMAIQYFRMIQKTDPSKCDESTFMDGLLLKASRFLDLGYKRLLGFECKQGGFDWFGRDPAHEALTAFGILQFSDMADVHHVDPSMMDRTRNWLYSRKDDENACFKLNSEFLHVWNTSQLISDAYICYALATADCDEALKMIPEQIEGVINREQDQEDTYISALTAILLYSLNRPEEGLEVAKKIAKNQNMETGVVLGADTSIVQSGGSSLSVETTALCVLAWLNESLAFSQNLSKAIEFLFSKNSQGYFGSTQSTVLALKAIILFSSTFSRSRGTGKLDVLINDSLVATEPLDQSTESITPQIPTSQLSAHTKAGQENTFKVVLKPVELDGGDVSNASLNYSMVITYRNFLQSNSDLCSVGLNVLLKHSTISEGETTECEVTMSNLTSKNQPMTIALIGIPGGLELRYEKLKELVNAKTIDFYETRGRELIIYKRHLLENEKIHFLVDCIAALPGTYTGNSCSIYLYYTDEYVNWIPGISIKILPK